MFVYHSSGASGFFLPLFIYPKDTSQCGEASSPHDVIEVVIVGKKQKTPSDGLRPPVGVGVGVLCQLEQIEFLSPADSLPPIIDPQFVVNVFGMGAQGVN
jgi:hypothetical protein